MGGYMNKGEKQMKICYIGNPQLIHLKRRIKYFVNKEHEVHVITPQPEEIEGAYIHDISPDAFYDMPTSFFYKIRVIGYFLNLLRRYRLVRQTKKIIKRINPDLIDAHYLSHNGIFASQLKFHPLILTCWGSDILLDPDKYGYQHIRKIKKSFKKADLIAVESKHMKKSVEKFVSADKIKIIPVGVDLKKFNSNISNGELQKKIKNNDELVIISTRNFEPKYNIQCIVEAFYLLQQNYENTKLILLGTGTQEKELKNQIKRLDIEKKIIFLGEIPHDEMPKYYNLSDIYVSSSLSDAMSVSKLEAMACGLIPVVSDIPANQEIIKDGENGFIFKNNPEDLSNKLISCIECPTDIKKNIIKSNFKIIENTFNWENNMTQLFDLYKNICEIRKH